MSVAPARYGMNVLVAVDRLANALVAGDPRLTLSSRTFFALQKAQATGRRAPLWARVLGAVLERIQPGHLLAAAKYDEAVATLYVIAAAAPPPEPPGGSTT